MPGKIQIMRKTYERLKDEVIYEPRGTVMVKGKGEMETWYLGEVLFSSSGKAGVRFMGGGRATVCADSKPKKRRTTMAVQTQTIVNGVNVDQLVGTINAIKDNPDLARFKFRAETGWISGGHSRTQIQSFYGAGTEDTSRGKPFVLEGDEPPVLLGQNAGPNAVEAVLHALASCLSVGFIYNAAAQGIKVDSLEFKLEGDLDLHAFLGLSDKVRPGYQGIRLTYRVKSDAPREKIEALCDYVQKTSPVLDIIHNPVPVTIELEN